VIQDAVADLAAAEDLAAEDLRNLWNFVSEKNFALT